MEERGVADDVHIRVLGNEFAQALHGELVRFGLAHVEGDLVLEVRPAVGHRVVHMHGVPDEVGKEADGVIVVGLCAVHHHTAGGLVIVPFAGGQRLACGAVHHLPPALDVVAGVYLHQLIRNALHQRDGKRLAHGGVKARHDIALLHLVRVGLGPGVILAGGVIGGINFGAGVLQCFREFRAVAVADGIRAPVIQYFQRFGHYVHVGGDGDAAPVRFGHSILLSGSQPFFGVFKGFVINHQGRQQQNKPYNHQPKAGQLAGHLPAHDKQGHSRHKEGKNQTHPQACVFFPVFHKAHLNLSGRPQSCPGSAFFARRYTKQA